MSTIRNLTGQTFSRLLVLEEGGRAGGAVIWKCQCSCGVIKNIRSRGLVSGTTKSCGCMKRENGIANLKDGNLRHGKTYTKLWRTWAGAVNRCINPNSKSWGKYGGRGIKIHPDWLVFEKFAEDVGEPPSSLHSIDRINNNGNYEPGNVRWATAKEQSSNRRSNRFVMVGGDRLTLTDAAAKLGVGKSTTRRWSISGKLLEVA